MQQNLYFRTAFRRENVIKSFLFDLMMKLSSYPKLIIEVVLRKNFGRRYFSLTSALTVLILILAIPVFSHRLTSFIGKYYGESSGFWEIYGTWYVYAVIYAYFAFRRWLEVKYSPSAFDFTKFSLYAGDIDLRFSKIDFFGKPDIRIIETLFEPALYFVFGGLLYFLLGQNVGMLFMVCSVFYSISYRAAYKQGDDFILDKIDEALMNEQFGNAFIEGFYGPRAKGVTYYMQKPTSRSLREKMTDSIVVDNYGDDNYSIAE